MSEQLCGVSFDWWGTLYIHAGAGSRRAEMIHRFLEAQGLAQSLEAVQEAYAAGAERFDREWRGGRVYLPAQWLADILADLGSDIPPQACGRLQRDLEEAMLPEPPRLAPGAADLLADLAVAGVNLAIISDTGLTIGRVMRRILESDGILRYFRAFAFSDEVGVYKPHPKAFRSVLEPMGLRPEEAVHVGDLPETDIKGATAMGMRAVLITGVSGREDDGLADAVVRDFAELRALFADWRLLRP